MKSFLKYSIILVALLSVTLIAGEVFVRSLPNPYKTKEEFMSKHASEVETIILGSSHTYYGINPEYLDGMAFNLAYSSQDYKYDYYLLSRYADSYMNLKMVIVPVSYFSFFSTPFEEKGDDGSDNQVMNYHVYMGHPCNWNPKYNMELCHMTVFRGKIMAYLRNEVRNCTDLGWGTDYGLENKVENAERETAKAAAKRHTHKDSQYLDYNLNYITSIIKFCKERSVRLVLVTTPKSHYYYDLVDDTDQQKENSQLIEDLKSKYGVEYYNYQKDSRFVSDDFYDADHLSDVGATKFTKILNEDLKRKH
jgi:hypothetical protein